MRICVITPTRLHGGLDVNGASLAAQGWPPDDLLWVIIDEWYADRHRECRKHFAELPFTVKHMAGPPKRPGMWNNFASAYNMGIKAGLEWGADLFVSLQDYFWIPPDGLTLYANVYEANPNDIYTGLASISADPGVEAVRNFRGGWTIFQEPWHYERPEFIAWADVRDNAGLGLPFVWTAINWELNWAAWPASLCRGEDGLRFDRDYERGVAYDNQWFALRAEHERGARVIVDPRNHAIGLPHKRYFPEIEAAELPLNNRDWHDERCRARGWPAS